MMISFLPDGTGITILEISSGQLSYLSVCQGHGEPCIKIIKSSFVWNGARGIRPFPRMRTERTGTFL